MITDEEFEESVYSKLGYDDPSVCMTEDFSDAWSDVYKAFYKNGCIGIIGEEEAISAYKWHSGTNPDNVTEWPEIDAITEEREKVRREMPMTDEQADIYFKQFLPYEPVLKYAY